MNALFSPPTGADLAARCQRALDDAARRLDAFGRSPEALDRLERDIHRVVVRAVKRDRVRSLVKDARSALRRLNDRGVYSEECWAYEAEVNATREAVMEAFWARNEVG